MRGALVAYGRSLSGDEQVLCEVRSGGRQVLGLRGEPEQTDCPVEEAEPVAPQPIYLLADTQAGRALLGGIAELREWACTPRGLRSGHDPVGLGSMQIGWNLDAAFAELPARALDD
jgi:hypothetical protein